MKFNKMIIGKEEFDFSKRTYIMGILNITPDSFSDGGKWVKADEALKHVEKMISEGADIIDVGGESTRPGHIQISEEEEIHRVCPIIAKIKDNFNIPISIDTYKGKVAQHSIQAGADLVNDIWGLKYDDLMPKVIAQYNKPCVVMHNRNNIQDTDQVLYNHAEDMVSLIIRDLKESIEIAHRAGISDNQIILDSGIGFGKDYNMNLITMNQLEQLVKQFQYPWLLGISRKSFIGKITGEDTDNRLEGTITANVAGIMKGQNIIRVHDVLENKRAAQVIDAILRAS